MQYIYPPLVQNHPNGNPYRYFTTVSWEIAQPLVAASPHLSVALVAPPGQCGTAFPGSFPS